MPKVTIRQLQKQLKQRNADCISYNHQIDNLHAQIRDLIRLRDEALRKAQAHVDSSMIAERSKLISQIGQMVEAVSQAIRVVVGKEVM